MTDNTQELDEIHAISDYRCICKYMVVNDGKARVVGRCVCSEEKKMKAKQAIEAERNKLKESSDD